MKRTKYELVCGLEVHAELKTQSKMFCACKNDPFEAPKPNIYTCPVCLGMPGGLPLPNKTAIEWAIKIGLALNCKINLFSNFDRKNYFYPDLAKGYQISQDKKPFCYDGYLDTSEGKIRIRRIHLEEDTGKLQHTQIKGEKVSLIDFNRSGVPLIEIVTEPDIKSATQAKEYGKKLRQILRYLDVADCDMERGGMRLEANISLREVGDDAKKAPKQLPKYKVEVKNINSFRFMEQAIEFEMVRQQKVLEENRLPDQETRGFNPQTSQTFSQRTKEDAGDYRYFPDPDIPPIRFTQKQVDNLAKQIPELPDDKAKRWIDTWGLDSKNAQLLTQDSATSSWVEQVFTEAKSQKIKASEIAKALVNKKITIDLSVKPAKTVDEFRKLVATDEVTDEEIARAVLAVSQENPDATAKYLAGDDKLLGFFMGQTIKKMGKKLDASQLREVIANTLKKG